MDIFENPILCKDCNKEMEKVITIKDHYKLRGVKCANCNQMFHHPLDYENYKNFIKLKQKPFKVKLRIVGNSYCVSIPKEIIEYESLEDQMSKIIEMFLEEPGKLSIFFSKEIRKLY